jgi:prepilin-type processing-associated H-X9-DG protein
MIRLYPYLEQGAAYQSLNLNVTVGNGMWVDDAGNVAAIEAAFPVLLCPSDGFGGKQGIVYHSALATRPKSARTNYLRFYGQTQADRSASSPNRGCAGLNYGARIEDVTDGTSLTMLVGEYLTGPPESLDRATLWGDFSAGVVSIHTQLTPNSPTPDGLYRSTCCPTCNLPQRGLPCVAVDDGEHTTSKYAAARSNHPGGVGVLMCDGSVRFTANGVSVGTWRAMGTVAGGEPAGE